MRNSVSRNATSSVGSVMVQQNDDAPHVANLTGRYTCRKPWLYKTANVTESRD